MAKVHYNVKQEVEVECEFEVKYSTFDGENFEVRYKCEAEVPVDEDFDGSLNPKVYSFLRARVSLRVISIPRVFKILGMRITRFVVVTHDLVVLSEVTYKQGKYVETLLYDVDENLPPPVPLVFHNVEGEFSRELQTEMEKPVVVYLYPLLTDRLDLWNLLEEYEGWNFRAVFGVEEGGREINVIIDEASVCEKDVSVMHEMYFSRKVVSLVFTVWKEGEGSIDPILPLC